MTHALLPADWNPRDAADRVLAQLKNICLPRVKGAHDSDFLLHDGKAYIVYMANDVQHGEDPHWPFVYCALTIVDLQTHVASPAVTFAAGGRQYDNAALPEGACFVPRIIQKNPQTLRCYFASENPGVRQAQTWFIDFDLRKNAFENTIHPMQMKIGNAVLPMQPQHLYHDAVAHGFAGPQRDYGLYFIDGFKTWNDTTYAIVNNFPIGQNALGSLNHSLDCVTIRGHFVQPADIFLTESALQRLPDGSFLTISRQDKGDRNYRFSTSADGTHWSPNHTRECVPNGSASKPTFDQFNGLYYLGWQESTRINNVYRSVFNIDISRDAKSWERKYRFETDRTFQYPTFRQASDGKVYVSLTQGDDSSTKKERITAVRLLLE